jgi:hypothetical protein
MLCGEDFDLEFGSRPPHWIRDLLDVLSWANFVPTHPPLPPSVHRPIGHREKFYRFTPTPGRFRISGIRICGTHSCWSLVFKLRALPEYFTYIRDVFLRALTVELFDHLFVATEITSVESLINSYRQLVFRKTTPDKGFRGNKDRNQINQREDLRRRYWTEQCAAH